MITEAIDERLMARERARDDYENDPSGVLVPARVITSLCRHGDQSSALGVVSASAAMVRRRSISAKIS